MHFRGLPHSGAKHCGRQSEYHCTSGIHIRVYYGYMDICNAQLPFLSLSLSPQYSTVQKKKKEGGRGKGNKDNSNCSTLTFINNCPITGGNAHGSKN